MGGNKGRKRERGKKWAEEEEGGETKGMEIFLIKRREKEREDWRKEKKKWIQKNG